jgi:hypothetical protein
MAHSPGEFPDILSRNYLLSISKGKDGQVAWFRLSAQSALLLNSAWAEGNSQPSFLGISTILTGL